MALDGRQMSLDMIFEMSQPTEVFWIIRVM